MPYDNDYNRMVADDIMKLNKKYISHEKAMEGSGLSGGFLGALAGMILPQIVGAVANKVFGKGMSGGACDCPDNVAECVCGDDDKEELEGRGYGSKGGFAQGTMMDTGFERTIGAGMSAGVKKYTKRKSAMGCAGAGRSGGVKKAPKKGMGVSGAGGSGGAKKPRKMKGSGIISDLGIPLISNVAGLFGLGSSGAGSAGAGMSGGAELGLPTSIAGEGKKKGRKSKMGKGMAGGKLVPVANMKASYMAGMGRSGGGGSGGEKPSSKSGVKRTDIVKKVMAERGLGMIEASKYVKEHNLY